MEHHQRHGNAAGSGRDVYRPSGFAIGIFLTALCLWAVVGFACVMGT